MMKAVTTAGETRHEEVSWLACRFAGEVGEQIPAG